MMTRNKRVLLGAFFILVFFSTLAVLGYAHKSNQGSRWERQSAGAQQALLQGQYADAERLSVAALNEAESSGEEDPRLAISLDNLAQVYMAQGKVAQAAHLYYRAIAISEKVLGPNHPYLAMTLNHLAGMYYFQRKYSEAELLYQRALAIYEKALEPNHPYLAMTLENYAALLQVTNRADKAAQLDARVKDLRSKIGTQSSP
jgi:tetratricopeptide (TPR) repeat protein